MKLQFGVGAVLLPIITFLLVPQTQAKPFFPAALSDVSRRGVSVDCKFSVPSNTWTSCASFTDKYNITLPDFVKINPEVEEDCRGFEPGKRYCLRAMPQIPISKDGKCGNATETKVTCIGSEFGDCCGRNGRCGSTHKFCDIGYCQEGDCPGMGYSTDGKCGKQHGALLCGGPFGVCCSNGGQCGSTNAECGIGNCQSGNCRKPSSSSSKVIPSSTPASSRSPTPRPSPYSPSPDGTCGYKNKYVCNGTDVYYGYCCSAAGYCGMTQYHCDNTQGCQSDFGLCDETIVKTVTVGGSATPTP